MYGTVDSNDTVYHDTARAPLESGGVYTEKWCRCHCKRDMLLNPSCLISLRLYSSHRFLFWHGLLNLARVFHSLGLVGGWPARHLSADWRQ